MREFFERLGRSAQASVFTTGNMLTMLGQTCYYVFIPPYKLRNIFKQMEFIGVKSLFIVILTGSFTGMVLAMQGYNAMKRFGAESLVGPMVALSMARELGPVLTGLMVTGRAGSAIATELGTMRVTEQIDALHTMAINPIKYLVVPRVIAGVMMLPILTILTDFVGFFGGYMVGVKLLGINSGVYITRTTEFVSASDIMNGVIKSVFFGLIISLVACYQGFYTNGGAEGVGRAATSAVVLSSVSILISDYMLTSIMFNT